MNISFGALVPPLAAQLGIKENIALSHLQTDADAVTRLMVRGVITEREGHTARQRLMKRIHSLVQTGGSTK